MSEVHIVSPEISMVSFDLWLTLVKPNAEMSRRRVESMNQLIAPEMPFEDFSAYAKKENKVCDKIAEDRGADVLYPERIKRIAAGLEKSVPTDAEITALHSEQTELLKQNLPELIEPGIASYLDGLKRDRELELAIISNTGLITSDQMRTVLGCLGLGDTFTVSVYSDEVGMAKPHPAIFERLLDESGKDAGEILHIGDNYTADFLGASAVGMSAVHIEPSSGVIEPLNKVLG
jgi:putative hydrolase of the HAD superfamily